MGKGTALTYMPALDGLRAIAALAVIGFHVHLPGFSGGFIGVEVFFVLSGFLITSLLLREVASTGDVRLWHFWGRRVTRLYPELLLILAGCTAASLYLYPERSIGREVAAAALYMSNLLAAGDGVTFTRHTWSLSIEMQFYLVWPFVVMLLARVSRPVALVSLAGLFAAATLWRMHLQDIWGVNYAYNVTTARLSGLVMGSMLAFGYLSVTSRMANILAGIGVIALAIATMDLSYPNPPIGTWPAPLVDLAAGLMILALPVRGCLLGKAFAHPALVKLGIWSYGIYLWQYPIARVARAHLSPGLAFVAVACASIGLAAASYRFVAVPAKERLVALSRFLPRKETPRAA